MELSDSNRETEANGESPQPMTAELVDIRYVVTDLLVGAVFALKEFRCQDWK